VMLLRTASLMLRLPSSRSRSTTLMKVWPLAVSNRRTVRKARKNKLLEPLLGRKGLLLLLHCAFVQILFTCSTLRMTVGDGIRNIPSLYGSIFWCNRTTVVGTWLGCLG
jgi:hypothetical protein